MDSTKYNLRNPAVKRLMQEMREIQRETSGEIMAEALEDNIFEWHFAIRGPPDTEYEGGIYHGRIILPPEYPFKPPSFIMITPSGRFETGVKICLSMSAHHPEHWQPSWSVRVALVALIAFLPTSGRGAIGSLDFSKEEKRALAAESRTAPPKYGTESKQQIINSLHARMLAADKDQAIATSEAAPEHSALQQPASISTLTAAEPALQADQSDTYAQSLSEPHQQTRQASASEQTLLNAAPSQLIQRRAQDAASGASRDTAQPQQTQPPRTSTFSPRTAHDWEDLGLSVLAVLLAVLIAVIVLRKIVAATGGTPDVSIEADLASFE